MSADPAEPIVTFATYHASVVRTARVYDDPRMTLVVAALGLAGETGELVDMVKKHVGHDHPLDLVKVQKEMGDVLYYLDWLASIMKTSLEEVAGMNVEKLVARYPDGFSVERSFHKGH
jgi:NTP pyrophosphatase (non-canonical NTP hydrolase)